jgi:hypothetical protein
MHKIRSYLQAPFRIQGPTVYRSTAAPQPHLRISCAGAGLGFNVCFGGQGLPQGSCICTTPDPCDSKFSDKQKQSYYVKWLITRKTLWFHFLFLISLHIRRRRSAFRTSIRIRGAFWTFPLRIVE